MVQNNSSLLNYVGNQQYANKNPNFTAEKKPISATGAMQNNALLNAASTPPENPLGFAGAAVASTIGLMGLNDYLNNPLIKNEYKDTLFKKIETGVDNLASKPKGQQFLNYAGKLKKYLSKKIENSEILRTLFHKPSMGGPMVESQAAGAKGHLATRALETMRKYKDHMKKLNVDFTEFDSILAKADKNSYKYYDEIIDTIAKSTADKKLIISNRPILGLGLIKNKTSLKEILNKDILVRNYKDAGKTLGQKVSGFTMRGADSLTNGLFGGKFQVLIQAFMIAQSMNEASKAEKGEKFSTFMASLSELMAMMATMSLQMKTVNHIAGLKNIGMSGPEHKAALKIIEIANRAAKSKDHVTYAKAIAKLGQIKLNQKMNIKWYQKPIKWIGDLMSFGRIKETIKPLKAGKIANFFAKIPYGFKVGAGYIGRVAFIMAVIMPIFSGIAKKISYTLFGKPTKTIEREKAKEKEEELKSQNQTTPTQSPIQQPQQTLQPNNTSTTQQITPTTQTTKPGDLLNKMQEMKNQPISASGLNTSIPATNINSPDAKIKRTYIPSPILGQENTTQLSETRNFKIDQIMRQADIVEQAASKYL